MTIRIRLTERPNWTRLGSITKRFGRANKIAMDAIGSEISSHSDDMVTDLYGQLDGRFQQYQSARQLQQFTGLVKITRTSASGFFLGIRSTDLHAWQTQFSQKQLNFLRYAARASGVAEVGVAVLPPTPFGLDIDVGIDESAIASKFYAGILGPGAKSARGGGKMGKMVRKAGSAIASLFGKLFSRRASGSTKDRASQKTSAFQKRGGRGKAGRNSRGQFTKRK